MADIWEFDALAQLIPGDQVKIPAATFNTFVDAARDFQARTCNRGDAFL